MEIGTKGKPKQRFFGVVTDVHDGGAYGFIAEVIDPYGRMIDANGDVYIGRQDADGSIEADLRYEFEVEPDPRREGCFKAVRAKVTRNLPVLAATKQQLAILSVRTGFHDHAKNVPPEEVLKAVNNGPFSDALNAALEETVHLATEAEVDAFILAYLRQAFPGLQSVEIVIDMHAAGNASERESIERQISKLKKLSMHTQAASLATKYEIYVATCEMLRVCRSRGVPAPGMNMSMGMLRLLLGGVDVQAHAGGDLRRAEEIKAQAELSMATLRFLRDKDLLSPGCLIPPKHIVDIFTQAPVCYIWSKNQPNVDWTESDPRPDAAVQYFAGLLGKNQAWAHFFQIWNRRTRLFSQYNGEDLPPHIVQKIEIAMEHFDFLVINTVDLDKAGREWEDPDWAKMIDPLLYGFKKGLPGAYFLGRWSDSGIFPLMPEMIADTIAYLRANADRLLGFGDRPYWYFADPTHPDSTGTLDSRDPHCFRGSAGVKLRHFALQIVKAFDEGNLFEVLRGEKPLPELDAAA